MPGHWPAYCKRGVCRDAPFGLGPYQGERGLELYCTSLFQDGRCLPRNLQWEVLGLHPGRTTSHRSGGDAGHGPLWGHHRGWVIWGRWDCHIAMANLSIHPRTYQSIHPSNHPHIRLSIHPSIHPSINPSIQPPTHPPINPSIHLPTYQSTNPSTLPPTYQSIHPCVSYTSSGSCRRSSCPRHHGHQAGQHHLWDAGHQHKHAVTRTITLYQSAWLCVFGPWERSPGPSGKLGSTRRAETQARARACQGQDQSLFL